MSHVKFVRSVSQSLLSWRVIRAVYAHVSISAGVSSYSFEAAENRRWQSYFVSALPVSFTIIYT